MERTSWAEGCSNICSDRLRSLWAFRFTSMRGNLRKHLRAILTGLATGSLSGLVGAGVMTWALHGSREIILSMLPKSATTPVSMEIVNRLGGIPGLGAVLTVLTGLLGSMIGPPLLRKIGIGSDIAVGTAMGTAAHGIGTARVIGESELQGGIAGFSMGLNAVVTSVLVIPLYWYFSF
ncbi:LrgB family protein [Ferviditalea candida]|uniref:LrgB family protein n=1 Tax=Ferviditalea candida TaxID=3108399 RepID=A0ABU5ZI42_9BACL|nr:LrgB family protein [Paenibacillaceae bacterium T2]